MRNTPFTALTVATLTAFAAPALAADAPDLIGTWTGKSRAVVLGSGGHYDRGEKAAPKFLSADLTIVWSEHDDGRYIGTITSAGHSEPKLGVVSEDGKTLITADGDGSSIGRIIDNDHFELCYTQTSEGATVSVASCAILTRSK